MCHLTSASHHLYQQGLISLTSLEGALGLSQWHNSLHLGKQKEGRGPFHFICPRMSLFGSLSCVPQTESSQNVLCSPFIFTQSHKQRNSDVLVPSSTGLCCWFLKSFSFSGKMLCLTNFLLLREVQSAGSNLRIKS